MIAPLFNKHTGFFSRHQWELSLMLLSLHALLINGLGNSLQTALIICHLGFFLLWQPVLHTKDKLSIRSILLLVAAGIVMVFFLSWWVIAFWLCALFALLGGRVFSTQAKSARLGYLLAASYLVGVLLMWVVPKLLNTSAELEAAKFLIEYLLPLIPIGIGFTKAAEEESGQPPILDFFYTLLLLMLAVILVLGSFAIQASSQAMYGEILVKTLLGLAIALAGISLLWNPRAGFSGVGQLLSRYLLSVGLPFEQWIRNIAELGESTSNAGEFTNAAMKELLTLPWVTGLKWDTLDGNGELGEQEKYQANLDFYDFHLTIFSKLPLTPALTIHLKLLSQILGEFYEAKRREETLRQTVYMQAIYETGSRLTHDIKNLVQSMSALCGAAEQAQEADSERLLALFRKQLPLLNQRLARTLEKLETPNKESSRFAKLSSWWNALRERYAEHYISFVTTEIAKTDVDVELLDSVLENLLQNAIEKRKMDTSIAISVEITAVQGVTIEVTDTGKPMPKHVAEHLFKKQVSSENGLGVGLYHAGKQAQQSGYELSLIDNRQGTVRFRLNKA
ncbi:sensor histidine kinase [Methyloradius palustris]|nr:HAMP domain-containing sensor histidine kinase [Methyloradius palustris]